MLLNMSSDNEKNKDDQLNLSKISQSNSQKNLYNNLNLPSYIDLQEIEYLNN